MKQPPEQSTPNLTTRTKPSCELVSFVYAELYHRSVILTDTYALAPVISATLPTMMTSPALSDHEPRVFSCGLTVEPRSPDGLPLSGCALLYYGHMLRSRR